MSCCGSCAEAERRAIIGGTGRTAGPAGDVYTGPPLTPEQICMARQYSARELAGGPNSYAARDRRDCLERVAAMIAAGRDTNTPRMPTGNIWNARETPTPFRQRRSTQDRAPMPGREPAPAAKPAPRPAAPAAAPRGPNLGGRPKGGASPAPARGASPFRPAAPNRGGTLMNANQQRAAMAALPKATQHALRQAILAASPPAPRTDPYADPYAYAPPAYEWPGYPAPPPPGYEYAPPGYPAPPGYEYAPAGYGPPPGYEYAPAYAEPRYYAPAEGDELGALVEQLSAWLDSPNPEDVSLAEQVIAELTGDTATISGPLVTDPTVRAIDDVISSIWGSVRSVVPYGNLIDEVHQARRGIMYGPEGRLPASVAPGLAPGARLPARTAAPKGAPARTSSSATTAIAELQRLVRAAARAGSSSSAARDLRALKTAARTSPEARRRWAAGVAVMRDDLARIRAAAR